VKKPRSTFAATPHTNQPLPPHSTQILPHARPLDGGISIYTAMNRGLISDATGEVQVPQLGAKMYIDDAIIQGGWATGFKFLTQFFPEL